MKHIIKKILKETYEYQSMNDLCQQLTTGSNQKSPEFMYRIKNFIMNSDVLSDEVKEQCSKVFEQWKSDMWDGVYNERTPYSGTGDSESDESDTYFTELQTIICGGFMDEMD